ncbi:MAG: DUF2809 domain-containing protein [Tessaracoccus sp.]|uniref:DUF2809 domain-containing protein n=1 Tax=Tessaracoccus sp. TaxID=1971211 RepID=UPI001EBFF507|nr:DUF2809 domain-containing protein [Tessaracoccus sp.]MBK7821668.1 DUF2809 domain-containing protein [Tessaracoccus sp.]
MVTRSRLRIAILIPVVVGIGLLARRLPGLTGDAAGGLLYATLLYLLAAFVAPRARALSLVTATAAVGVLIELLQLTGVPAVLGNAWPSARLVFGSTFAPLDLAWAVAGAALGALTDLVSRKRNAHQGR